MLDGLTRVWNRRGADSLLKTALINAETHNTAVSVCLLDVDRFKDINERYGHPVGDEVLCKLAARLVQSLRVSDIVCRYGGDEFLLILPDITPEQVVTIVDRICTSISELPILTRKGDVHITLSLGYATENCGNRRSHEELIQLIDEALMKCKRNGRNQSRADK